MATTIFQLEADELRIVDVNPMMLAIMDRELDSVLRLRPKEFLPPFVATPARIAQFETIARGASDLPCLDFEIEDRVEGELWRAYQVFAYGGDPGTVAVQLHDITARKREELRLRRRGDVQQELLDLLPHPVYWCDEHGRYVDGNKALCQLLDAEDMGQLVGEPAVEVSPGLAEVLPTPDTAPVPELDRELEFTARGEPRTLLSSRVPLRDQEGAAKGFVGILHDISVRKQMERELLERRDSLEQAVLERTEQLAHQLSLVAAQRETIHDLSTPVIQVWDGILVLPLIGLFDARRCLDVTHELLEAISLHGSRCVILDVTAISSADKDFPFHLHRIAKSTRLLGCRCVLSGLQPHMAKAFARMQAELDELISLRNLKSALHECITHIEGRTPISH